MANDAQYEALYHKYQRALATNKDLKEREKQKEEQWQKIMQKSKNAEAAAREFCAAILSDDPNPKTNGKGKPWNKYDIVELIKLTENSYKERGKAKTDLLNTILDQAEERALQIEGLQDLLLRYQQEGCVASNSSRSASEGNNAGASAAENPLEIVNEEIARQKELSNLPPDIQNLLHDGEVGLIDDDSDGTDTASQLLNALEADMAETGEQVVQSSVSIPTTESEQRKQTREANRAEGRGKVHMSSMEETIRSIDSIGWLILQQIGQKGLSWYQEIENGVLEADKTLKEGRIRRAAADLVTGKVINREELHLPLSHKAFSLTLSPYGKSVYAEHFQEESVKSEAEMIISEHDNLDHGYGIKEVAMVLKSKNFYQDIETFNRKSAIVVGNKKYVADIVATTKSGEKEYFEYERGLHTRQDYYEKFSKIVTVTRYMNIVMPNKKTLLDVGSRVNEWIGKRKPENLKNIIIRLTTSKILSEGRLEDDSCWQVIYDLNKGAVPIKNVYVKES